MAESYELQSSVLLLASVDRPRHNEPFVFVILVLQLLESLDILAVQVGPSENIHLFLWKIKFGDIFLSSNSNFVTQVKQLNPGVKSVLF